MCNYAWWNQQGVKSKLGSKITELSIGHPFGIMKITARIEKGIVKSVTIGRTARRLMEGWVYID